MRPAEAAQGLQEALEHARGTHTLEDVLAQVEAGEAQLWRAPGAVIVTEIKQTPRRKVVHFWLATGDMRAVLDLHKMILAWAQEEHGCDLATLSGRRGWVRALRDEGWDEATTVMARELDRDVNRDGEEA